jgi:hypothetical protein
VRKQLISLALLALMPLAAQAQDEDDSGFNWNAAATSEYMFRGISQTDDHPAIQAGAGYSWSNGLYVGAWASNVDFGEDTDAEVDTFYNELIGKLSFAENYSATLGYTNDFLASETDSIYVAVGGSWEVGNDINLTAGLGYTTVDEDLSSEDGYLDYSIGVNRDFGPVNIGLGYIGTDNSAENLFGKDNAEDKFVLTFAIGG